MEYLFHCGFLFVATQSIILTLICVLDIVVFLVDPELVQYVKLVKEVCNKNDAVAFPISIKCAVQHIGRFYDTFTPKDKPQPVPQVQGIDSVVFHKADTSVKNRDTRSKDIEAVVSLICINIFLSSMCHNCSERHVSLLCVKFQL